jgi:hypothetical protein
MAASRPVVSPMVSAAAAAARKSLADESRTAPPAPMAARGRPPKPLIQVRHTARARPRAPRQTIIRPWCG